MLVFIGLFCGAFCLLLAVGGAVMDALCEAFPKLDELICGREEFEEE